MQEGEIRAKFRILADDVKGDVAQIQKQVEAELRKHPGSSVGQAGKNISVRGGGMSTAMESFLSKLTPAARARVMAENPWIGGGSGGGGGGGRGNASAGFSSGGSGGSRDNSIMKAQKDRAAFIKDATFAMMPLFNPTSVWGNLFASRQIFSAFAGTKTGGGMMGKVGLSGVGGAALATGGTVAVLLSVGVAIKALTKTMQEVLKAYQNAPALYAKALTSGLGLGFTAKTSILAGIMGVSEKDVFKFGQAFQYLNPQIEFASKVMASTNRNLTAVGWSFRILDVNLKAFFATIANDYAPMVKNLTNALSLGVKIGTAAYSDFSKSKVSKASSITGSISSILGGGIGSGFGFGGLIAKILSGGISGGSAPPPMPWMKQLRASPWEHMGLNIGASGQSDYARRTANAVETLVKISMKTAGFAYIPSGQFNFSPTVANP